MVEFDTMVVPFFFVLASVKIIVWWAMPICVAVESLALAWIFGLGWKRALGISAAVNGAALVLGSAIYVPFVFTALPFVSPALASPAFGAMVEVGVLVLVLAVVDTGVELPILRFLFRLPVDGRSAACVGLANLVSGGILIAGLFAA